MKLLRMLVGATFSGVFLLLLTVFALMVFAPGTEKTAFIFQKWQMVRPWLDPVVSVLLVPVTWAWNALVVWMPQLQTSWFPRVPAEPVMAGVVAFVLGLPGVGTSPVGEVLRGVNLNALFPGLMDWRLLVALLFWGKVESLFMQGISMVEAKQYRRYIRQRDAEMLRSFQDGGK